MYIKKFFLMAASVIISFFLYLIAPGQAMAAGNIFQTKLANGLDVIVVENHTVPLATVVVAAKNGAYTETPEYNGLSHFYEHMFFKGNAVIPSQEQFQDKIRELGISYNGFTTREAVVYFFTLPVFNLNQGLHFMNNAIRTPLFDKTEIEKEKGAVLGEYDRNESSPSFHLNRAVEEKVYWKYFSRVDVIGDRKVIQTVDRTKMQTIQKRFYGPNNCALLVVGDVKHDDIFNQVRQIYSDWKSGPDPFKLLPVPKHPPIKQTEIFTFNYPAQSALVEAKWQGPNVGRDNLSTYALDVYFTALNIPSSKFQKRLVESGIADYAGLGYYTQRSSGEISLDASLNPEKVNTFKTMLLKELENMKQPDYITDEELETAKKNIEINYLYKKESSQDYATNTLGFWWAVSGLDYYLNYIDNVKKIKKADIRQALNKYFFNKKYVMGLLVSKEDQAKNKISF
jgi:zinc protease